MLKQETCTEAAGKKGKSELRLQVADFLLSMAFPACSIF